MDLATLRAALESALAEVGESPAAVYLFGSEARGSARPDSDVDVGVLYRHPELVGEGLDALHLDLAAALEARLGRRVDLVVLDRAPVDLVKRVFRDGVLLLEADRAARVAFEVQKRNEYFDLQPILERIRRAANT